ncbi:Putative adenylate kinase [uncultured archaeon]|nr:Putative adenylate kinase [uncultured archaeon]
MLIVITGTPGTGKTTASALLGKMMGMPVLHLREFVKERKLSSGFDKKTQIDLVDLGKLGKELSKELAKGEKRIVEGHLACEIPLPAQFVFVLRCEPGELRRRMKKRRYARAKLNENLMAEMLDYCTQNSEANCPEASICELETSGKTAEETAARMLKIISGKAKGDKVDYRKQLKEFLELR